MSTEQIYQDDLEIRFANHSFTETIVGSFTTVKFNNDGTVDTVTDSGGVARFNVTLSTTMFVGQEVSISGFTTNTSYNTTAVITATDGSTYFEVASISFGTDETGSVAALILIVSIMAIIIISKKTSFTLKTF